MRIIFSSKKRGGGGGVKEIESSSEAFMDSRIVGDHGCSGKALIILKRTLILPTEIYKFPSHVQNQ